MFFKIALVSVLVVVTVARPGFSGPVVYDYNYAVRNDATGTNYNVQESRDEEYTQGSYYVQLPDGRLQKVAYTVNGDEGFQADVTYEGEATYPQGSYGPTPAPSYRPAPTPAYH